MSAGRATARALVEATRRAVGHTCAMDVEISAAEARARLLTWLGLAGGQDVDADAAGVRGLLDRLRHIQLDPLDVLGTNADLVAMARSPGLRRGEVYRHLGPDESGRSASFEHFAKVRCILPPSFFPRYRDHLPAASWWTKDREKRLPDGALDAVLAEVAERGPVRAADLGDLGRVRQLDWHGWKSTGKAATMAVELLWRRCAVVVSGKDARGHRLYDVPERALGPWATAPSGAWSRWAVTQRAAAAGLLPHNVGPWWSTLRPERDGGTVAAMVADGELVRVRVRGLKREFYALPAFLEADVGGVASDRHDDRMRILGPLDPLLWDRTLVEHAFEFSYVWEVYKPAKDRQYGWYVVPLLHGGELVGRLEARIDGDALRVDNVWWEPGKGREAALEVALADHAARCGARRVRWARGARVRSRRTG